MEQHDWNVSHAAQALGISRNTLYRKFHRHGITPHPRSHN
jgi:transcriptional regulator of acetoin/glycerol metabolism